MSTSLNFIGPSDLSVGEIELSNQDGLVTRWMATQDKRSFTNEDAKPGYYLAEITPAGMEPRSIIFRIDEGEDNRIEVPNFAALIASGRATNFLDIDNPRDALQAIGTGLVRDAKNEGGGLDLLNGIVALASAVPFANQALDGTADMIESVWDRVRSLSLSSYDDAPVAEPPKPASPKPPRADPKEAARKRLARSVKPSRKKDRAETRYLSVGLTTINSAQGHKPARFEGPFAAQLLDDKLRLRVARPENWSPESGDKLRLSLAVQNLRLERLHLPLYRAGTSISINPVSRMSSDVDLEVLPIDARLRGVVRALRIGNVHHAEAVRDQIFSQRDGGALPDHGRGDPWDAMLTALIYLRFPEVFGPLDDVWVDELADRYSWAADALIIKAQQTRLAAASDPDHLVEKAEEMVALLRKARAQSSPYYSYANQMYGDLCELLCDFQDLSKDSAKKISRLRTKWQKDTALQRGAGISFSWLARDQKAFRESDRKKIVPNRKVTGRLYSPNTNVVFEGRLSPGAIAIERAASKQAAERIRNTLPNAAAQLTKRAEREAWAPKDCPALSRPAGPDDDPNKGRFGGQAAAGGFELLARFGRADKATASIELEVASDDPKAIELGDSVWFCLHPTFNPVWVRIYFDRGRASLPISAWGGFVVGAWLPRQGVELELDLAAQDEAPHIIKTR